MKKVVMYTTPTCAYCKLTKEFFKKNEVEFTEYDVTADATKRDEMIERSGQMGVPVIDVEGEMIVGFDENKLKTLLEISS